MEETGFSAELAEVVRARENWFDTSELPQLRDEYRTCQSAVNTIFTILLKKGIVAEDPYKHDKKISDVQVPPDTDFADNDRNMVVGVRLSDFESMLDFLCNYYRFTVSHMKLNKIKDLVALNNCFGWANINVNSPKPNTKGLALMIQSVRQGSDTLAISMLNDSLNQLTKSTNHCTAILKNLTEFQKEVYKMEVRTNVLSHPSYDAEKAAGSPEDAMKQIRKLFPSAMGKVPFYTELIEEVIKEEYSEDSRKYQEALLDKLRVAQNAPVRQEQEFNAREVLLDGVRAVGSAAPQLELIVTKIDENKRILMSQETGFMLKVRAFLRKAFNIEEKKLEYEINVTDPATHAQHSVTLNYVDLMTDLNKRVRLFNSFSIKKTQGFQKIESMPENQILEFLIRQVAETQSLLTTLSGLDDYFKAAALPANRARIKGIRVELSAIKNSLIKANQRRVEYTSYKEEQEQLKKLGITG